MNLDIFYLTLAIFGLAIVLLTLPTMIARSLGQQKRKDE